LIFSKPCWHELNLSHDFKVITQPNSPAEGIRVAMIEHNGAPIELIEFENREDKNINAGQLY
jgi:hypothetical protein